jgi:hypothetical protein
MRCFGGHKSALTSNYHRLATVAFQQLELLRNDGKLFATVLTCCVAEDRAVTLILAAPSAKLNAAAVGATRPLEDDDYQAAVSRGSVDVGRVAHNNSRSSLSV